MIVFDTESDGFVQQATKMWIATTICSKTEEMNIFIHKDSITQEIEDFVMENYGLEVHPDPEFCDFLLKQKSICAHNIFKHDLPLLNKLYDFEYSGKVRDTLTMSTLYDPDRRVKGFQGGHSIAAWGHKFGIPKPEHEDWSQFSTDMIVRNVEDTKIGLEVYRHLMRMFKQAKRKGIDWSESFLLEHDIAHIIAESEQTGVVFDVEHAKKVLKVLDARMDKSATWLLKRLPHLSSCPTAKCKPADYAKKMAVVANNCGMQFDPDDLDPDERFYPPITTIWVKSGGYNSNIKKFFGEDIPDDYIWGPFTKVAWDPISLTSINQIKRYLKINDWVPDEFTPSGQPKVTASSLSKFKHPQIGERLADYLTLAARRRTILNPDDDSKGWLNNLRPDGRIPSLNNPQGTPTGRSRHKLLVNVPSVDADYGALMRDCFTVKEDPSAPDWQFERVNRNKYGKMLNSDGKVWSKGDEIGHTLVSVSGRYAQTGCDASGLEMRMLAHEMGDMELVDIILNEDIHTYIWNIIEDMSSSRGNTKGIEYACLSMDTQCLTKSGWKHYDDLKEGELVLTYNMEKDCQEWKPILEKVKYEDAPVYEISQTGFSARCTSNHRWFVDKRSGGSKVRKSNYVKSITTTDQLNTECRLIVNANYDPNQSADIDINEFNKNSSDFIPMVLNMSKSELNAFLLSFCLADGWMNKRSRSGNSWHWGQNEGNIQEALLLASYLATDRKLGVTRRWGTNKEIVSCRIGMKPHITGQNLRKEFVGNQPVWCIRTENESFVMRYKDTITITGNTIYGSGDRKLGSLVDINRDMILERELEKKGWKFKNGIWRKGEQEFETFFDAQSFELGKILRAKLMAGLPALHQAIERNKNHVKKHGYLIGLDGRRLKARSAHSALNLKLQSGGAIVMKKALQLLYKKLTKEELDAKLIIFYHDEFQIECHPDIRHRVGKLACKAIQKAGEHFDLKCPLAGEYKVGLTWGDCH